MICCLLLNLEMILADKKVVQGMDAVADGIRFMGFSKQKNVAYVIEARKEEFEKIRGDEDLGSWKYTEVPFPFQGSGLSGHHQIVVLVKSDALSVDRLGVTDTFCSVIHGNMYLNVEGGAGLSPEEKTEKFREALSRLSKL
ncbi:MAG: hypothetical protein ABIP54_04685 [Candidatus Andersenbacteria bacterium]